MGFFRNLAASGGSGGRGSGRGGVDVPNRTTMAVPNPTAAIAPGGNIGPVFAKFGSFFATLPLRQAPVVDMGAAPDMLHYSRPRYDNTAGRDAYSAPTTVSWTANQAVGAGGGGRVSPIPTSVKRYDVGTFYRWLRSDSQRYPFAGEGTPRPAVQHGQIALSRRKVAAHAQMAPGHQSQVTTLPPASSFGATTNPVLAPFQTGESVFA